MRLCEKKNIIITDVLLDKENVNIKQIRNMSVGAILVIVMFWGYLSSLQSLWKLKQSSQYAMLYYEDMTIGFSRESAVTALEENAKSNIPMRFVFWKQKSSKNVAAVGLKNYVETDVMAVCGRTDILYRGTAVLDVKSLRVCLISSTLAFRLFGNSNVDGMEVMLEDKTYEIAGVADSEKAFLVYEPDENETVIFDRVTVYGEDADSAEELSVKFKGQYKGWRSVNYRLMFSILSIVVLILPVGMGMYLLRQFKKYYNTVDVCMENKLTRRYQAILWYLKSVFILILLVFVIGTILDFPIDMIPDRWSNFEFWSKWWDGVRESGTWLVNMEKNIPDQGYWTAFMHGLGYQLIAIFSGSFILFISV